MSEQGVLSAIEGEQRLTITRSEVEVNNLFHYIKTSEESGINMVGIYTEAYNFAKLKQWTHSRLGEAIMKFLRKKKYMDYLKCIYIDTEVSVVDYLTARQKESRLKFALHKAYLINEKENIKVLTNCRHCGTMCGINFFRTNHNNFNFTFNCCDWCALSS